MKKISNYKFFKDNGFLIIKNFFSKQIVNECLKYCNSLDYKKIIKRIDKNNYALENNDFKYLKNPQIFNTKICMLINYDVFSLVKNLLNENFYLKEIELHKKSPGTNITPPHQDNFYFCLKSAKALTIYIPLNDQKPINGSLYVYPKSHKFSYEHHRSSIVGFSSGIDDKLLKLSRCDYSLSAGDISVHHCNIVHGAPKNVSAVSRTSIAVRFISTNDYEDEKKRQRYLKFLQKSKRSDKVL